MHHEPFSAHLVHQHLNGTEEFKIGKRFYTPLLSLAELNWPGACADHEVLDVLRDITDAPPTFCNY
jgi:hypothetical protein